MTAVTVNDKVLFGLGSTSFEFYNAEVANGYTLETGFDSIVGVIMTAEESQSAATAWGYSTSSGQITFTVDSTKTYSILVIGRR